MADTEPKLKILQVTAALNEGGVERGTLEMAAFTVAQGAESHVASNGGKLVPELEQLGGTHHLLPLASRTPWSIAVSAFKLTKIIRENGIGLVHARSRAPAWAALLACRLTSTKMITTFHGTHRIQNRLKWYYNSVMVRGERVIAISEFIRDHIIANYQVDPNRIDVAPRGYEPKTFNPELFSEQSKAALRHSLGIKSNEPIISLPGRLTRWKGQTVFLEALAEIKDLPWHALLIGGAGKKAAYENELKKLAADLGIEKRVSFLGSQSEIAKYYAISDIVVSASTEPEAFGRVAVEAQAMGKPILASRHGGTLETVRDGYTGWLYDSINPSDLATKLLYAIGTKSDLLLMGQRGQEWVRENFSVESMCESEWKSYQKIISVESE